MSVPFQPSPMSSTVALNKNAFPTRQQMPANPFNSAQFSCVVLQAQNQAFVRFAVMSSAAQTAIALHSTSVLEPFNRRGLSLSRTAVRPAYAGVLHRCCERNVVAPGRYSKRFLRSNRALEGHFSARNGPENASQVGFWPAVHC